MTSTNPQMNPQPSSTATPTVLALRTATTPVDTLKLKLITYYSNPKEQLESWLSLNMLQLEINNIVDSNKQAYYLASLLKNTVFN